MMHPTQLLPIVIAAGCLAAVSDLSAQPRPTRASDFPAAAFDSADKAAFYFVQYDGVAWAATDKVTADAASLGQATFDRLGEEWFCFKRDSTWHAVFGRFDAGSDKYDAVLHYISTRPGHVVRTTEVVDSTFANRVGRALHVAKQRIPEAFAKSNIRFNSYVRQREDGAIDVLFIPSWQQSGWILYGSEFQYTMDPSGRTVMDSVVRLGDIKGARPDSTATIQLAHDKAPGIPTVAEVLFIRLYSKYFAHVRVRTRDWVTEFYKGPPEPAWIHALREESAGR